MSRERRRNLGTWTWHFYLSLLRHFEQTPQKLVSDIPPRKRLNSNPDLQKIGFEQHSQKIGRTGSGQNYQKYPNISAKIILYTQRLLAYSPVLLSLDFQKASLHINGMKTQWILDKFSIFLSRTLSQRSAVGNLDDHLRY